MITAALAVAAATTLSACGSSGGSNTGQSTPPGAHQPSGSGGGSALTATETEFHIALSSKSLTAGTHTFTVKNAGKITHAFTVDGPGVEDKSTGDISAGDTKTLTVTLKAGTYDVYCPVGDHKMEGMDEKVTVS